MGCSFACCAACSFPKAADTATGRRMILQNNAAKINEWHITCNPASSVKITECYVEKPDGDLLFTKLFEPKDPHLAKAMICYSSGFTDHITWGPHELGCKYAELGFVVFMADWKGHGRSDGDYIHIADFYSDIVDEGEWVFNYAINKYIKSNEIYAEQIDKNNNYFISGASMGGAITINIALKSMEERKEDEETKNVEDLKETLLTDYEKSEQKSGIKWKGIVLVCPLVGIVKEQLKPESVICCLNTCCVPCCPRAKIVPTKLAASLTKDKALAATLDDNPLRYSHYHQKLSLTTAMNLYNVSLKMGENAKRIKIAMWIGHGDDDMVTSCDKSEKFYHECACQNKDKTLKIYKGKGHLLYAEEPNVYNDAAQWMMERINL